MNYKLDKNTTSTVNTLRLIDPSIVIHVVSDRDTNTIEAIDGINVQFKKVPTIYVPRAAVKLNKYIGAIDPTETNANLKLALKAGGTRAIIKRDMHNIKKLEASTIIDYQDTMKALMDSTVSKIIKLKILFELMNKNKSIINNQVSDAHHVFIFAPTSDKTGSLFDLLQILKQRYFTLNIDGLAYVAFPSSPLIPLIHIKDNKPELISGALSKIKKSRDKWLESVHDKLIIANTTVDDIEQLDSDDSERISNLVDDNEDDNPYHDSATLVNTSDINNALSNTDIGDPEILDQLSKRANSIKHHEDGTEQKMLASMNDMVMNDKKISVDLLDDPDKLTKIVSKMAVHGKSVNYIEDKHVNSAVNPGDTIKTHRFTAPLKHSFEFNESIHLRIKELFDTLKNDPNASIEVVDFKHEYKDDNVNRYTEYTITVQNKSGGRKKPYELKLDVPALTNGKYFKLSGKDYILATQQFLMPITKDKPNRARFISQYNMITLETIYLKFSITQLEEIAEYIHNKHPSLVDRITHDKSNNITSIVIKSGGDTHELDFQSELFYKSKSTQIRKESSKYYMSDKGKKIDDKLVNGNLFVFETLSQILTDQGDTLRSSKTNLPYIRAHIMGRKMPFIEFMIHRLGLVEAMSKLHLDYEIVEISEDGTKPALKGTPTVGVFMKDGNELVIYASNYKQELIANGIVPMSDVVKEGGKKKHVLALASDEITQAPVLVDSVEEKYGKNSSFTFQLLETNFLDNVTKKLFNSFGNDKPDLYDILSNEVVNKLVGDKEDDLTDLSTVRARQSELITALLYRELSMATTRYKNSLNGGVEDAHIFLQQGYIINNLLGKHTHNDGSSMLNYIDNFGPIEEITTASRVIKTGIGGIPNTRSFRKEHRGIHDSYKGNVSSHSTSEYTTGIVNHHTLGALIDNETGRYLKPDKKAMSEADNWDALAIDEALVPFVDQMDSDRLILARTHNIQKIPIAQPEPPIVATGAETVVNHITSEKFCKTAGDSGTVTDINHDVMTVKYSNGKSETMNISDRYSSTKRNSTVIRIGIDSLKIGDKFDKDQLLYWSKSFNGDSYTIGRNVNLAIINYKGMSHEDGYVISESMANQFQTDSATKVSILVPPGGKILYMSSIGDVTQVNEPLLTFTYKDNVEKYIASLDEEDPNLVREVDTYDDSMSDGLVSNNSNINKLSIGGEIIDIKIFISRKMDVDSTIMRKWKAQNVIINKQFDRLNTEDTGLVDNLDMTPTITQTNKKYEGAVIEFYIKSTKILTRGDKVSNRFGAKGVVSLIMSADIPLKTSNGEVIDVCIAPTGVLGRKNTSILKELYLGKLIKHLGKWSADELSKGTNISDVRNKILKVYSIVDPTKTKDSYNSIKVKFNKLSQSELESQLKDGSMFFNIVIPPFSKFQLSTIKTAASMLKLELDEYVDVPYILDDDGNDLLLAGVDDYESANIDISKVKYRKSDRKVPVGPSYFSAMEQLSSDYESVRATNRYNPVTGQPLKGKDQSAQAVGELDMFAMLGAGADKVIKELHGARSDNFQTKKTMINELKRQGHTDVASSKDPSNTKSKSSQVFTTIMTALCLKVE